MIENSQNIKYIFFQIFIHSSLRVLFSQNNQLNCKIFLFSILTMDTCFYMLRDKYDRIEDFTTTTKKKFTKINWNNKNIESLKN